jgi:hypothetical protein
MEADTSEIAQHRRTAREHLGSPASRRWSKIGVTIVALTLVGLGVFNGILAWRDEGYPDEVDEAMRFDGLTSQVVEGPIDYPQQPPAGGAHAALPHECGIYRVPVQDEHAVATLATGAVWIAYDPALPEGDVEALQELARGELDVILAPYPGLDAPIVVTAWGRQLTASDPEDPLIRLFLKVYTNDDRAPDADARCLDGVNVGDR